MNLEELTKHQIVLLTLLVSFITSIATGIVTVSLMDYAPPSVTKTVNQIVERTVERVVPPETTEVIEELQSAVQTANVAQAVQTVEKVVVVERGGSLKEAIASVSEGLVRLYEIPKDTELNKVFIGYGLVLTSNGIVVGSNQEASFRKVEAIDLKGETFSVEKIYSGSMFGYYQLTPSATLTPITSASYSSLELGQTVYSLSGKNTMAVSRGIVASLPDYLQASSTLRNIETDINISSPGIVLFDDKGAIVGLSGNTDTTQTFISIDTMIDIAKKVESGELKSNN